MDAKLDNFSKSGKKEFSMLIICILTFRYLHQVVFQL
jgi:hypothetical protein